LVDRAVHDQHRHRDPANLAHRIELLRHQRSERQPGEAPLLGDIHQRRESRFDDQARRWRNLPALALATQRGSQIHGHCPAERVSIDETLGRVRLPFG